MDFTLLYKTKDAQTRWIDIVFYVAALALCVAIICYCIFAIKIYFLSRGIAQMDGKIAVYGTEQQKAAEQQALDYKKKIDDFTVILGSHKLSSNLFAFVEKNTLPEVWFSDFGMSTEINELRIFGEADTALTVSRQVRQFEGHSDYIRNISVLNSQVAKSGKVTFVLNMYVTAKMFEYGAE